MANADTPEDAQTARNNGAQGIGLCRTEHMVSFCTFLRVTSRKGLFLTGFLVSVFVFVLVLCL